MNKESVNIMKLVSRYKSVIAVCLLVMIPFLAGGCTKPSSSSPSLKDLEQKILSATDMQNLQAADSDTFKSLYEINPDEIEGFCLYTANTNIKADEIALIQAKDAETLKSIQDQAAQRLKDKEASFKDYLPEEYYKIQKSVLKTHGNYLLLVVSPDSEKIEASFDNAFK